MKSILQKIYFKKYQACWYSLCMSKKNGTPISLDHAPRNAGAQRCFFDVSLYFRFGLSIMKLFVFRKEIKINPLRNTNCSISYYPYVHMFQGYIKNLTYTYICVSDFHLQAQQINILNVLIENKTRIRRKTKKKIKKIQITKKNTTHIQIVVITKENIQKTKKKIQNRCLKKSVLKCMYISKQEKIPNKILKHLFSNKCAEKL